MKIIEILLPKNLSDRGLTTSALKQIDALQSRMTRYVDKIGKLSSGTARDFLKTKLKADYISLKSIMRENSTVTEAVHKLPLTPEDFDLVKKLMEKPIPAIIAPIYIMEIIQDDELNDQLRSLEESQPGRDVRPLIADWLKRVMPDQMYRFGQEQGDETQKLGLLSPIHGYDPHQYKGSSFTGTESSGDAYGYF